MAYFFLLGYNKQMKKYIFLILAGFLLFICGSLQDISDVNLYQKPVSNSVQSFKNQIDIISVSTQGKITAQNKIQDNSNLSSALVFVSAGWLNNVFTNLNFYLLENIYFTFPQNSINIRAP